MDRNIDMSLKPLCLYNTFPPFKIKQKIVVSFLSYFSLHKSIFNKMAPSYCFSFH